MKIIIASLALLLVTAAWSAEGHTEKAISDLEYKWAEAQKTGNVAVAGPLIADTFINTDADSHTYGKAELLSNLEGGKWEINGISDVKVRVYGNAAIATGSWRGKGIDGDGTPMNRSERWTDTWVKTTGKWQCVASQQTTSKN